MQNDEKDDDDGSNNNNAFFRKEKKNRIYVRHIHRESRNICFTSALNTSPICRRRAKKERKKKCSAAR